MSSWLRGMLANSYYQLKKFDAAKQQFELIAQMEKDNDLAQVYDQCARAAGWLG